MKSTFDLQNPWRNRDYNFPSGPYIRRRMLPVLLGDLKKNRVTVLLGSRQVGKTFLIRKLIQTLITDKQTDPNQIFYFNFDAFDLMDLVKSERDFLDFISYYGLKDKKAYVFWDEAQRIPEVGLLAKRYYDLGLNIKLVISGSSSLQIKSQVKESLAGRKHLFELFPVSYDEYLNYNGVETPQDLRQAARFEERDYQRFLEQFVIYGGYPGVVTEKDPEDKKELLKEIYRSYVQKDISDFLKIEDIAGFNRMVQLLAAQSGALCKINEVAKNVRISRHYVDKYLLALQETYIAESLKPYFPNLGKAIVKTAKVYFCDTGMRNTVFGTFEPLQQRSDSGFLVEGFVFSELLKSVNRDRLWFYRTTTGTEVDFLFVKAGRVIPVEVKYSASRQRTIPRAFKTLSGHLGHHRAMIITRDYLDERGSGDLSIAFKPAWSIFNIGQILTRFLHESDEPSIESET